jgi:hypothetical protein
MFTYAIYNFILWGATLSAYAYEKTESKNSRIVFYSIAFFIPFIFLAIRYDIGTDYQNYVDYFYVIANGNIVMKEPGYLFVNYFIASFGFDVQWLFVFFGFFMMLFFYKALPRDGFTLGVFLFIALFYLYQGYSVMRQGLAIAIMAYAMKYIYSKKFLPYLFWAIFAMMFHLSTALILLVMYPFANIKTNKIILIVIIIAFFIMVKFTNISAKVLEFGAMLIPKYKWYLASQHLVVAKAGLGISGTIIKISIPITIIFFKDEIINKYAEANVLINFYFLYTIFYLLHTQMSLFGRLEDIFIFSAILSIVYFSKTFEIKGRVIILFIIGLFYYLMFMRYIATGTAGADNGGVYVNPYQTVLFDRVGKK